MMRSCTRFIVCLVLVLIPACAAKSGSSNIDRGKAVYASHCAACHGATGVEGGVGPSLRNLKDRMDISNAASWIRDPQPPMPKLYPSSLNDDDVREVAAYVDGL